MNIFCFCKLLIAGCRISAVCGNRYRFFGWFHCSKCIRQKLTVAISVLFELVICDNGAVFANGFFQVCGIAPVFFSCFAAECCFRI